MYQNALFKNINKIYLCPRSESREVILIYYYYSLSHYYYISRFMLPYIFLHFITLQKKLSGFVVVTLLLLLDQQKTSTVHLASPLRACHNALTSTAYDVSQGELYCT